jgi:type II secretory pathway component GspD/PulD (secretin)
LSVEAAPPQSRGPAAAAADKAEQRTFRLKYIAASDASRILRELFGDEIGRKAATRMSVDERTNTVIVSGGAARLDRVEAILQKIDTEGASKDEGRQDLKIFPLNRIEPDQSLSEALQLVFRHPGKFVVDRRRRLVLASGDQKTLASVEELLTRLDIMSEGKTEPAAGELQVRVFWLTSGLPRKKTAALPDDLKDVEAELGELGVDKPRLATQVAVSTVAGAHFEMSGVAQLDAPYRLSLSGRATDRKVRVALELTVSAARAGRTRDARGVASLRTQATVPLGRPVVLGVTPTEALTSAFVVQVVRKQPPSQPAKPLTFEFRNTPWSTVLEWLSDQTGLAVITPLKPTGTFTFVPPQSHKSYSVPEVIDILNEALLSQKYLLIRREHSLIIVPADEKIDPEFAPRLRPEDLEHRGRTELVSVVIPLHALKAEEVAPEIKKLLGPFGDVVVLKKANQVVVQDTAGNLRRVYQLIKDLEPRKSK